MSQMPEGRPRAELDASMRIFADVIEHAVTLLSLRDDGVHKCCDLLSQQGQGSEMEKAITAFRSTRAGLELLVDLVTRAEQRLTLSAAQLTRDAKPN
jgi:hypothetical protein